MYEYLNDQTFLNLLDRINIRVMHIKLTLLDFQENTIREIAGTATGNGTLNVNGASAVRRTISFNMLADANMNDLTDLDNIISINKKFKLAMGIENPLVDYKHYGDIIWFPLGMYVISKASLSLSATSCTISISGKDKMCLLDGSVGGTLPNTVVFHEIYEKNDENGYIISYPTIRQIILKAVNYYGEENINNIIINDLDDTIKKLVKWGGDSPIWLDSEKLEDLTTNFYEDNPNFYEDVPNNSNYETYGYGEDVGYTLTEFSYPGELILSAGETVVALLNKIVSVLGNYEFFYDINGKFIFQEIPNYLNKNYSLIEENAVENYVRHFNNSKYAYSFKDAETIISINNNPNYDNIKNDFIVWGQRPLTGDATKAICYRLAIDEKPELDLCTKFMYKVISGDLILRYEYEDSEISETETKKLIAPPGEDWREELYRRALEGQLTGVPHSAYDIELLEFWRQNFDPKQWRTQDSEGKITNIGWNPDLISLNYDTLNYWLDFIDISSSLGKYSVKNIGRRSKVKNDDKVRSVMNRNVPDIIFAENPQNTKTMINMINEFNADSLRYCFLTEENYNKLLTSATGSSAYDVIRELLYLHLVYNTQVTISSIPKYYLDSNILIYIQNKQSGLAGEYVITSLSLPLGYSGNMNITANEALTRV